ncbi:regulatory protein [Pelistega indica]|uniref:Regulatory protein n=1 Tax=Pelistega indica TaxID=1414851 RepID=V8G6J1_9BURK|nr:MULTISPECIES: hypothetical protein [Pelistega]ETD71701.1 regulatory protein [Pelistega indica]
MWVWFTLAIVFLILEVLSGTFYLMFLAIAMFAAGLVAFFELSIYWQLGIFVLILLLGVFVFKFFGIKSKSSLTTPTSDVNVNMDIGTVIYVNNWNMPRSTVVHYRGTQWQAVLAPNCTQDGVAGNYVISDINGVSLILTPKQ